VKQSQGIVLFLTIAIISLAFGFWFDLLNQRQEQQVIALAVVFVLTIFRILWIRFKRKR